MRSASKVSVALNDIVVRYARTLRLTPRILHDAVRDAKNALSSDGAMSAGRADDALGDTDAPAEPRAAAEAAPAAPASDREQHG